MKSAIALIAIIVCLNCFKCRDIQGGHIPALDTLDNSLVISLNELTYRIADEHDHFYSFIGVRAFAMVHLAIHDIFSALDPEYEPYLFNETIRNADPVAAASAATREILIKAYPDRADTIHSVCERWISTVPEGPDKTQGMALGKKVAALYIRFRDHDGHEKRGDYTPMTKPGDYQYTPGYDWVLRPDFSVARPFTLDSLTQFRSPPPPSLSGKKYAEAYQEVKSLGEKQSGLRTADQTRIAHWWAEFGEHSWNRIARITAKANDLSVIETNRMFALLNMNLYDLYMVSLESKYYYDTWRPYTAIRLGQEDTNPETTGDIDWEPEMVTPPWPEYPSAHAAVGAAGAEIVTRVFGTPSVSFSMESVIGLPGARKRSYENLDQAADDCANSRIYNGYHFRFATEEGKRQGRALARHTIENYLQPIK